MWLRLALARFAPRRAPVAVPSQHFYEEVVDAPLAVGVRSLARLLAWLGLLVSLCLLGLLDLLGLLGLLGLLAWFAWFVCLLVCLGEQAGFCAAGCG
jgi:hypothetical protein